MKKSRFGAAIATCTCAEQPVEQVSWFDFSGTVPQNAVLAGCKKDGRKVYVGQVYHVRDGRGIGLVVVEVFENTPYVYAADALRIYHQDMMIKVLMGPEDIFEWVDTNINIAVEDITHNKLVKGGYEHWYGKVYEYIGRLEKNGEVFLGRAMKDTTDRKIKGLQMIYNHNNNYKIVTSGFQVLTVKLSKKL